ncbi:hypothetical protein [Fimbriimonas ginsengisoli]|uniref:Uncharacterized protein n=1 Tax=Fimbriimonas ginsengisoli Gsoil 348 TaxID=661478 RepID=A0A068NPW1_FIMGI|nr:hypothetical protein [Fimbriimonas ginsengisoli]AIE85417.1 hypothetical protein OP10G_2049 [Fimbriimonas ginsengisoli Gsoil 348]
MRSFAGLLLHIEWILTTLAGFAFIALSVVVRRTPAPVFPKDRPLTAAAAENASTVLGSMFLWMGVLFVLIGLAWGLIPWLNRKYDWY